MLKLASISLLTAILLSGCVTTGSSSSSQPKASTPAGPAAGMNATGEVVDSSKIEAGSGKTVKGRGDWEGEVTGKPAAGSKFTKLEIGMSMREAVDVVGQQPTDSGAYVTGKAWIPFYYGSDRHRYEMVFKGQGRLIFAGGSLGNYTGGNLIWIIHNKNESGYR
jgi:ABC-type Fe3+-hydroxamate transport system substrate-binding protein